MPYEKFSNYLEMHFEWLWLGTVYKYFSPYGSCKIVISNLLNKVQVQLFLHVIL